MSYTFGGATSDDISFTASMAAGGTGQYQIAVGWFYPTTLTSGRFLWSAGNVHGLSHNSTTDQLRYFTDNTTDGEWTADPDLVINKWWYVGWMGAQFNTGPTGAARCWVGDAETPPTEFATTAAVAPVGNFTSSSNRTIGNRGTGTVAFQGDIGWMSFISLNGNGITNGFTTATTGAIADSEAAFCLERWIKPLWLGRPEINRLSWAAYSNTFNIVHCPLMNGAAVYQWSHDKTAPSIIIPTVNGATFTHNSPPRAPPENWPLMMPYVRRAA